MAERRTFREKAKTVAKTSVQFIKKLSPERAISRIRLNRELRNVMSDAIHSVDIGHIRRIRELVQDGADPNIRNSTGYTPLLVAAWKGDAEACVFFIEKGTDVNATDKEGRTALMHAVRGGQAEICALLIENGAGVNAKDKTGWTPFIYAAHWGRTKICALLIGNGADIEATDKNGNTALGNAKSSNGRKETVAFLGIMESMEKGKRQTFIKDFMACTGK
jgi:ankyrin repeat protein